jgi:predicted transcriptional regulator
MDDNEIANLFYSLASESRIDILHELNRENLRMNELARKIDITATEASRQIQRLLEEGMVQKQPDGTYNLTNYGKLILHFFPSVKFISKHRNYFQDHDIWQLPYQFISRIGELSAGTFVDEVAEVVNRIEEMMKSSEDHVWVITDQVMGVHLEVMKERISKGIKFRSLIPPKLVGSTKFKLSGKNVETRVLSAIPGLFSITEKEALIALLSMDGKLTHSCFIGNNPSFIKWANDVYIYYWDKAKRIF